MNASRDSSHQPGPEPKESAVPRRLAEELARLEGPGVLMPPAGFDEAVLAMAAARMQRRPVMRVLMRVGSGLAAAAVLGLVVWVGWPWPGGSGGGVGNVAALDAQMFDPTKRVDIVDAFVLARRLERGAKADASWDVTRDGAVDQADVERLRTMAVRLDAWNGGGA